METDQLGKKASLKNKINIIHVILHAHCTVSAIYNIDVCFIKNVNNFLNVLV